MGSGVLLGRRGHLILPLFCSAETAPDLQLVVSIVSAGIIGFVDGKLELASLLSRSASTGPISGCIWSAWFSPVVKPVYTPGHVVRATMRLLSLRALVLTWHSAVICLDIPRSKPTKSLASYRRVQKNACIPIPDHDTRSQHGWRQRAVASDRYERRRFRKANHCSCKFVHSICAWTRAS